MNPVLKQRILHRSKILQGHMTGLEKMIDSEANCMAILTQSFGIQKLLASLCTVYLKNHLTTHLTDRYISGEPQQQTAGTRELLDLYEITQIRGNLALKNT